MPQAAALQPEPRTERYPLRSTSSPTSPWGIATSTETIELRLQVARLLLVQPRFSTSCSRTRWRTWWSPRGSEDEVVRIAAAYADRTSSR